MEEAVDYRLRLAGWLLFAVWVGYCIWLVASSIITSQTTGIVHIKSADARASLVVGQDNAQAKAVGLGAADIRLKPGTYWVSAITSGKQTNATVSIHKKQSSRVYLGPAQTLRLPSVATINFQNMDSLIKSGFSTDQINDLEEEFFHFKPKAQTISIDPSSIKAPLHGLNPDGAFIHTFVVSVDGTSYNASTSYAGPTDNVSLQLYAAQSGKLVFDSTSSVNRGNN